MKLNPKQELALWIVWVLATVMLWLASGDWFFRYDARYTIVPLATYPVIVFVLLLLLSLRTKN